MYVGGLENGRLRGGLCAGETAVPIENRQSKIVNGENGPSQGITERGFTGQKENMELGLMYYNARYYVPGIGRFASADTIVPDPANPQAWNRYAYTYNNPLRYTDSTGHKVDESGGISSCKNNDCYVPPPEPPVLEVALMPLSQEPPSMPPNTNEWPAWTYHPLFPDYFTIQGTLFIFSGAITIDTYSNVYISGGVSFGPESIAGSLRAAGGWIVANQVPSGWGYDWERQELDVAPSEAILEQFLRGWSAGGGGGIGGGIDGAISLSTQDPLHIGVEGGIYSPQLGGGGTFGAFIYDAGSDTPWFWQKWGS